MTGSAKQSMPLRKERLDCFVAALPCANASRLSQAMTKEAPRHCEPTGRANARPMTGSAKQSMPLRHCERSEAIHAARKNGLLRRFAPRNDGGTSPSLRANGSRECAPTGSVKQSVPLRHCERSEAIHLAAQRKNGLLRRFAPRNDGVTWSGG